MKKIITLVLFVFLGWQSNGANHELSGELKGGLRIQKAQKRYWENGFCFDFASPGIAEGRIHFGASYVTSRLGSALGSNAIKQDNFLVSAGYFFRHQKQLQPFARLHLGYFHADYEEEMFNVLTNSAFLFPVDAGLTYNFNVPVSVSLSAGYNFNAGDGTSGPGTLYPVFYQLSIFYTIFNNK